HLVFAVRGGEVLLERRPPQGIWGGLWAPPEFADARAARSWWITAFGPATRRSRRLPTYHHAFTHFDLDIHPWVLELADTASQVAESGMRWQDVRPPAAIGLPAPVAKIIAGVLDGGDANKESADGQDGAMRAARARGGRPRSRTLSG
ncbi:MAG: NUDIX domain-containing protein, partial [Steroidobacteraceae bacterium]